MAYESAVENVSDIQTTAVCPGCNEEVNLLQEHLNVTITPQRNLIEMVDAALVGAETDEEGNITQLSIDVTDGDFQGSRDRFYMGTRGGAGISAYFHSYDHLADWANEQGDVKIEPLKVDSQAEGRVNE
jgi:hypothetical protein